MWSKQEIHAWYENQPYPFGCNFIPSNTINQLEMWQASSFDPDTIQRELSWASKLGMNVMRVYLHDLLWQEDSEAFCSRINTYLQISYKLGIRTMFVLFDDCWNQEFALGQQPEPAPFTHNSGWVQSPGVAVVNDPNQWDRLEAYVAGLLNYFKADERIFAWDLYNEPGNGSAGDDSSEKTMQIEASLPLLKAVFSWARSVNGLIQPVTTGAWNFDETFTNMNAFVLNHSDFNSFHCYLPPQQLVGRIRQVEQYSRPVICTEYMARGNGSSFPYCLPVLKKHKVGAIHWGLVAGKTQTIYPWNWSKSKGEPDVYFHDVFWPNGSFIYPEEEGSINRTIQGLRPITKEGDGGHIDLE